jgi:hypothetical protein
MTRATSRRSSRLIFVGRRLRAVLSVLALLMSATGASAAALDTCGVDASCAEVPGRAAHPFHALRVDALGQPAADPLPGTLCATGIHPQGSRTVGDGGGGILIGWIEPEDPTARVRVVRRDASGAIGSGWPSTGVVLAEIPGFAQGLGLVADGAGGAIAAWIDHRDPTRGEVRARRVDASGAIVAGWTATGVPISGVASDAAAVAIAPDGGGGLYASWQIANPLGPRVRVSRFLADGTRAPGWPDTGRAVCAIDSAQSAPIVAADGAGGAIVAWEDRRDGTGHLHASRWTAAGALAPGWPVDGARVSTDNAGQRFARMVADGAGGAFLAWQDARTGEGRLYAQRLDGASGAPVAGWSAAGVAVSSGAGEQFDPAIANDGVGGLLCAWIDHRAGAGGDVYLQRIGVAGALMPGWPAVGAPVCTGPADAFAPSLGDVLLGASTVAWDESGDETPVTAAPSVPPPARLAIQWIAHGWSPGALRVRLALPSRAPVSLEVIDVAGRRVGRHVVSDAEPGWLVVALDARLHLAPGFYIVRVSQNGRSVSTKAIVLQ